MASSIHLLFSSNSDISKKFLGINAIDTIICKFLIGFSISPDVTQLQRGNNYFQINLNIKYLVLAVLMNLCEHTIADDHFRLISKYQVHT